MSAIRNCHRADARKKRSWPYSLVNRAFNSVLRSIGYVPVEDIQDIIAKVSAEAAHLNQVTAPASPSENARIANDKSLRQSNANSSRDPFSIANSVNITQPESLSVSQGAKSQSSNVDHPMDVDNSPQLFAFTYSAPGSSSFSTLAEAARNDTPTTTPKKRLAKNPNGSYRWEGAGSAKQTRPRNRYASPAFGASPSKTPHVPRDNARLPETPLDSKRRKVNEEGTTGSRQSASTNPTTTVPFPTTSTPTTPRPNGVPAKSGPIPSSRLRTPAKPTTPVVPSPLRQAWSDSPSPSPKDDVRQTSSHPSKQTKTANLMAELIKETTPVKKPDLSNPYQTASPVGKVGPPRRGTKRTRATGKPSAPAKEQATSETKKEETKEKSLKEYSAQAIIEATVPKGSKRSRPPAHFEKQALVSEEVLEIPLAPREPPVTVERQKQAYIVEEPDEDEDDSARAFKKTKTSTDGNEVSTPGKATPSPFSKPEITVEEIGEDVVMEDTGKNKGKGKERELPKVTVPAPSTETTSSASPSSPTSRSPFSGVKPSSIPKEPSKLRFSFQAESSSVPPSPAPLLPAALPHTPPTLPKPEFKFSPPSESFSFTYKADAKATSPKSHPPSVKETASTPSDVDTAKAKARAADSSSLPQFDFTLGAPSALSSDAAHIKAQNAVKVLSGSSLPSFEIGSAKVDEPFSFNYDPSKPKPSPKSFTFKTTPQKFTLPKVDITAFTFGSQPPKPTASFPVASSSSTVQAFDYAAAGMKPTVKKVGWICSVCLVPNESSAAKCQSCENPSSRGSTSPAVKGFDFAAAGMKAPTVKKDTYICSHCGLSNPSSAPKCETCDTPSPSASSASPQPSTISMPAPPTVPVIGFNYAAAGMVMSTPSPGTWKCSVCGAWSPDAKLECISCENSK